MYLAQEHIIDSMSPAMRHLDKGKADMLKTCIESGLVGRQLGWCPWNGRAAGGVLCGSSSSSSSGGHGCRKTCVFFWLAAKTCFQLALGIAG